MTLNYTKLAQEPNLLNTLLAFKDSILYNDINCCRVAVVNEFYPESMQVQVNIVNKLIYDLKEDGSQVVEDYAPITAKICYAGNGVSYPLKKGDYGLIIFSDREIESWYINGQVNQLAYDRCHAITDAIFIAGLYAQPTTSNAQFIDNCLHIFYGVNGIKITDIGIEVDGNLLVNGSITATGDIVAGGISLQSHIHGKVQTGTSTTSGPKQP